MQAAVAAVGDSESGNAVQLRAKGARESNLAGLRSPASPVRGIEVEEKARTLVPTTSRRISLLGIVWVERRRSIPNAGARRWQDHRGGDTHRHATAPRPARRSEEPLARVAVFAAGEYSPSSLLARLRFPIGRACSVRRLNERRRLLPAAGGTCVATALSHVDTGGTVQLDSTFKAAGPF